MVLPTLLAPPNIRREVAARIEKTNQESDRSHPLCKGWATDSRHIIFI